MAGAGLVRGCGGWKWWSQQRTPGGSAVPALVSAQRQRQCQQVILGAFPAPSDSVPRILALRAGSHRYCAPRVPRASPAPLRPLSPSAASRAWAPASPTVARTIASPRRDAVPLPVVLAAGRLWKVLLVPLGASQRLDASVLCAHCQGHRAHRGWSSLLSLMKEKQRTRSPSASSVAACWLLSPSCSVKAGTSQDFLIHTALLAPEYFLQKRTERVEDPPFPAAEYLGLPYLLCHPHFVISIRTHCFPGQQGPDLVSQWPWTLLLLAVSAPPPHQDWGHEQ